MLTKRNITYDSRIFSPPSQNQMIWPLKNLSSLGNKNLTDLRCMSNILKCHYFRPGVDKPWLMRQSWPAPVFVNKLY